MWERKSYSLVFALSQQFKTKTILSKNEMGYVLEFYRFEQNRKQ